MRRIKRLVVQYEDGQTDEWNGNGVFHDVRTYEIVEEPRHRGERGEPKTHRADVRYLTLTFNPDEAPSFSATEEMAKPPVMNVPS